MLLAVDVGNTNVVFALIEGREIKGRWRIATDPRRTADEYAVWLLQLMQLQGFDPATVGQFVICTVVPRAMHNLQVLAQKYFKLDAQVAGEPPLEWGFVADVDQPSTVGADRAVNAVAAHARYPGDLIVVDFGTATTFDVIDPDGIYKGGIIAPGINLSLDALVNAAAKLPRIAVEAPRGNNRSVIGRNTEDAMHIGVFWGYVAMMEGLIARLRAEIGRPLSIIATGGLAVLFHEHTSIFDHVDTDLTLDGLAILAERARG
ncbi:type III pantothenate kinase [Novosphingobium sp. FKTRR1]|uniref:type III pantothenate kinase n=1 Tax=unclassified Novosphingobium TaxID=2644732 RepID=UPI001CF041D9|nr:type III pantothenate kinase [Novosphingobium sp. FKTRR1]